MRKTEENIKRESSKERAEVFTEGNKTFKRDSRGLAHKLNFQFGPLPGWFFFSYLNLD